MLKRGISYNACLFAVTGLLDSLLMLGLQNSLSPFLEKQLFFSGENNVLEKDISSFFKHK